LSVQERDLRVESGAGLWYYFNMDYVERLRSIARLREQLNKK